MNNSMLPNIFWGVLLVLAGVLWLGSSVFGINIDFGLLWPVFLLIPGLILWGSYLFGGRNDVGVLIPANILVFLSITFFFNMFASSVLGYDRAWLLTVSMYSTGPVAIAFWITWVASGRKGGYLVPAVILTIISACIALFTVPLALFDSRLFVDLGRVGLPLLMILVGLLVVFGPLWGKAFEPKGEEDDNDTTSDPEEIPEFADAEEAELVEPEAKQETVKNTTDTQATQEGTQNEDIKPSEAQESEIDTSNPELKDAEKIE